MFSDSLKCILFLKSFSSLVGECLCKDPAVLCCFLTFQKTPVMLSLLCLLLSVPFVESVSSKLIVFLFINA